MPEWTGGGANEGDAATNTAEDTTAATEADMTAAEQTEPASE
ncbi:hypothetical protein SRB17_84340 [Streptomyces sp. RB17]|nr:hypothetical protein [Streptomyces sp. RB17]MQY40401.1 hypothetical protein [Streptomyces sp. RB17]